MYCPEVLNFGTMRVHNCDVYVARLVGVTTTTTTTTLLGGEDETAEAADSLSLENNQSGNTLISIV